MKIFSLQSKMNLLFWGLGMGVIFDFVGIRLTAKPYSASYPPSFDHLFDYYQGFPVKYLVSPINDSWSWIIPTQVGQFMLFLIDLLFWILAVFIILTLIRYFKNKSKTASS